MPDNTENTENSTTTNTDDGDDFEVTVDPIDNEGHHIDPETGDVIIDSEGDSGSGGSSINIKIVNANELTGTDSPNDGLSFIMVDRTSNTGILLDYNKLADTIYGKLYSENMEEDSLKFYIVDEE